VSQVAGVHAERAQHRVELVVQPLGGRGVARAHELDNLYVADTSCFPSISAVNPALTAMANAVRVSDHLLQRLGAPHSSPRS
jgi:hypothetical protein